MRIVNQNKEIDINYDDVHVFVNDDKIIVSDFTDREEGVNFGKYKTKKRALNVMAEIRKAWIRESIVEENTVFEMPKE